MFEMLTVLIIYMIISFAGMAALWTIAVKKGVIARPAFFFWVKAHNHDFSVVEDSGASNIIGLGKIQGGGVREYALAPDSVGVALVYAKTGAQGAHVQNEISQSSGWNRGFSDAPDSYNSLPTLLS